MWEEDPSWQQANYKAVIYVICFFTVLAPIASLVTGDWEITRSYFFGLGILAAALCLYAAVVWTAIHIVLSPIHLCKKLPGKAHKQNQPAAIVKILPP